MLDEKTPEQREQEKRDLLIEVLDKGILGHSEAGMLASLLEVGANTKGQCHCREVCDGCDGVCNPQAI